MSRLVSALIAALVVAMGGAACGERRDIAASASSTLQADLQQIRTAATAQNRPAALAALGRLRQRVDELRRQGEVSDERAGRILAAASAVEARLALVTTTTTTTTTVTTVPAVPRTLPAPLLTEDPRGGDGEDKGRGKGRRDDKDDGDE